MGAADDQPDDTSVEVRQVKVSDPRLSNETNGKLTREVQAVVQKTEVRVPADRPRTAEGKLPGADRSSLSATAPWLGVVLTLVVIALVALFTSGGGWLVAVALLLVIVALSWIVRLVLQATRIPEHASPTTTAALRAEGIANPDEYLSEIVDEFTEPTDTDSSEDRTTSVQEDPAQASAEHKDAMTPTSGRSKAVGP